MQDRAQSPPNVHPHNIERGYIKSAGVAVTPSHAWQG